MFPACADSHPLCFMQATPFYPPCLLQCSLVNVDWGICSGLSFISLGNHTLFRVSEVLSTPRQQPSASCLPHTTGAWSNKCNLAPEPLRVSPSICSPCSPFYAMEKPLLQRGQKKDAASSWQPPRTCWYIKPARLHTFPSCLPEDSTRRGRAACRGWAGRRIQQARKTKSGSEPEDVFFFFLPPPPWHGRLLPLSSLCSWLVQSSCRCAPGVLGL